MPRDSKNAAGEPVTAKQPLTGRGQRARGSNCAWRHGIFSAKTEMLTHMVLHGVKVDSATMVFPSGQNGDPQPRPVNRGRRLYLAATWQSLRKALRLSRRELQVIQAVFDDCSESAIADELEISVHTVHTYLKRLYHKLGARSRVELVCIIVATERQLSRHDED